MLEIITEKGIEAVEEALCELERISPLDMSADKVSALCDHLKEKKIKIKTYKDPLSEVVQSNLYKYDELRKMHQEKMKERSSTYEIKSK